MNEQQGHKLKKKSRISLTGLPAGTAGAGTEVEDSSWEILERAWVSSLSSSWIRASLVALPPGA